MHSSKTIRVRLLWGGAVLATTLGAISQSPPSGLLEKLSSEDYPARIDAEKRLMKWAEAEGDPAMKWLLTQSRKSKDPEVRRGAAAALKAVIIRDLTQKRPGFVGIKMSGVRVMEDQKERIGVEIQSINPDTPAEKAGLRVNDVVLKLNGEPWTEAEAHHEFAGRIEKMRSGDKIRLELLRDGKKREIELELVARPWSMGLYSDNLRWQAEDPFAGRPRPPLNEEEAKEEAFREWIQKQEGKLPSR